MQNEITESLVIHADEVKVDQKIKYHAPRLSVESRSLGKLRPNSIRVQMIYTGVCGTDVHLVQKNAAGFVSTSAPLCIPKEGRVFGHEGIGKITALGSNVHQFEIGDFVALESIITCGTCDPCRRGNFNQCLKAQLVGMQVDGLFSNYVDVPATLAHKVNNMAQSDDGLIAAACLEPAGVAWLALKESHVIAGDTILIFGGGPIGYFCAMLAKLVFGASWVGLVEPIHFRRSHASSWCDEVFNVGDDAVLSRKYDVVIEASGYLENVRKVLSRINANGRIVLLARSGEALVLDGIDHIITNSIHLMGVRGHLCGAFGSLIELYQNRRIPLHQAVTGKIEGLINLKDKLEHENEIIADNCKVLLDFKSN